MVRWVVGSILHGVDPLSYFSFQPVLHDWCNKGRGMYYSVCGMMTSVVTSPLYIYKKQTSAKLEARSARQSSELTSFTDLAPD